MKYLIAFTVFEANNILYICRRIHTGDLQLYSIRTARSCQCRQKRKSYSLPRTCCECFAITTASPSLKSFKTSQRFFNIQRYFQTKERRTSGIIIRIVNSEPKSITSSLFADFHKLFHVFFSFASNVLQKRHFVCHH